MNFETYLQQAWNDHGSDARKVAAGFTDAVQKIETGEQLSLFVNLMTHVMGEHLAEWEEGKAQLERLRSHSAFQTGSEADRAIARSIAVLKLGRGQDVDLQTFSASDQIRVLAVASSALSSRSVERAKDFLLRALSLARAGLEKKDPANRALAVTGNNLACALEEKNPRSADETDLMIISAKTGREFWGIAGGWIETSRAEYRLGMSYLAANDPVNALKHAQICLELCRENGAGDFDMFFAYEVLARVESRRSNTIGFREAFVRMKDHFDKLSSEDQSWCEPTLKKVEAPTKVLAP